MSALRWLIQKDLLRFFADRNGAILTFCVPMVLAILLSVLFAPPQMPTQLKIGVVDQDQTEASKALIAAIEQQERLLVQPMTETEARELLQKGELTVAVVFPKGTGAKLTPLSLFSGEPLPTELLHDPSKGMEADMCKGMLTQVVMQEVGRRFGDRESLRNLVRTIRLGITATGDDTESAKRWIALLDEGLKLTEPSENDKTDTQALGKGMQLPLAIKPSAIKAEGGNTGYNTYAHNFAGALCMFLMFWALDAGKELINERDSGALLRVRSTPALLGQVLLARGASASIVALLMTFAIYALGILVFGIQVLGSPLGFALVVVSQAFFIGGMAVLLAGISRTERQVTSVGGFAVLIMSFLGGAWMPSFLLPDWVQTIALALPSHWSTEGLAAMTWRGLPLESALMPTAMLIVQGAVCAVIGWRMYRWD